MYLCVHKSVNTSYIHATQQLDEKDVKQLLETSFKGADLMPTFIEDYIQQGHVKGQSKLLLHLIQSKFGNISTSHKKMIESANSEMILAWSERILVVDTIEQLFSSDH